MNTSPASTRFRIRRRHPNVKNVDKAFKLSIKEGVIPALGIVDVEATMEPSGPGLKFEDHFTVEPSCLASKSTFTLCGSCPMPQVSLEPNVIEFGCSSLKDIGDGMQAPENVAIRTFVITNHSGSCEAVYEILCDSTTSVFKFSSTCGVLKVGESRQFTVTFHAPVPINFYRRVTILIAHHSPLVLDLLGTAFNVDNRPAAIKHEHLIRYMKNAELGLARYFPEQLQQWLAENKLTTDEIGALQVVDPSGIPHYSEQSHRNEVQSMEEYFEDGFHTAVVSNSPYVSFDREWLYLSLCDGSLSKPQTIHLTNHTYGKIIAHFAIVPKDSQQKFPFVVEPMNLEVAAGRSAAFTVRMPTDRMEALSKSGTFVSASIECYCFHSVQRVHTLVQREFVVPPWSLTLNIAASTYATREAERSVPVNLSFSPPNAVFFPSLVIGESYYRSVVVTNKLDLPSLLSLTKPENDECFELKPSTVVVRPGATEIVTIRFQPNDAQLLRLPLNVKVNESEKNIQELTLVGSAEPPEVIFEEGNMVFIAPTCASSESVLPFTVRNSSRQRIEFIWSIPNQFNQILSVRPTMGCMEVHQSQKCHFTFSPKTESRQIMKVKLTTRVVPQSKVHRDSIPSKDYFVKLIAESCTGTVVARQSVYDYGSLRVGRSQRVQDFVITNTSDCPVRVRLVYQQQIEPIDDDERIYQIGSGKNILSMHPDEFLVNPHCDQNVVVHVRPKQRCRYIFQLAYQLFDQCGEVLPQTDPSVPTEIALSTLVAEGIYPQVMISDVQASGSARLVTKRHLWQLLSLDDLNACLGSDPHEGELAKSRHNYLRHSARRRLETTSSSPEIDDQNVVDYRPKSYIQWDLGAMPLNTDPWKVHVTIQNSGPLDAEWQFLFPTDLLVDIQPWAENLDFSEDELHEMMIVDNKLFDIQPRRGLLQANGGQQMITIQFRHQFVGLSRLPVLLKITDGREVLLTLTGASVGEDTPYLYLPKTRFCLAPVSLGDASPPIQPLELFNGGRVPVNFAFDLTAIHNLTEGSFGHEVFNCLTPSGTIAPGRHFEAQFKFSPLEARNYVVDVPLRVEGGDMHMLTVVGLGYDRRMMGDSAPDFSEPGLANPPSVQGIHLPNQPARLSVDRLQLGNVPLFVRVSRAVLLHNLRLDSDLAFQWKVTDHKFVDMVDVEPATGVLQPGQATVCQVTFTATPPAAFHEVLLVCLLSPHADVNEYKRKLAAWEAEREAQLINLGVEDDRDISTPNVDMVELSPEKALEVALQPRFGRLCETIQSVQIRQGKGETRTDPRGAPPETSFHTVTIPPLLHGENEDLYFAERFLERATAGGKLYPKPFPPSQTVLQLAVTARTHDPGEFIHAFGVQTGQRFVSDLTLVQACEKKDEESNKEEKKGNATGDEEEEGSVYEDGDEAKKMKCKQSEVVTVSDTLSYMLMKTLKEADMKDMFRTAVNESVPSYIEMLGVPQPVSRPPSVTVDGNAAMVPGTPLSMASYKKQQSDAPETALILDSYLSSVLCSVIDDAVGKRFDITRRPRLKAVAETPKKPNSQQH